MLWEPLRKRKTGSAYHAQQSSDLTLLPLFLNLLALFAVLVAASDIRPQKAEQAVSSIVSTFQHDMPDNPLTRITHPDLELSQTGKTLDDFRQFAERSASLRRLSVTGGNEFIRLDFNPLQLFDEPQGTLKIDHRGLLVRLARLQGAQPTNWVTSIVASLPIGRRDDNILQSLLAKRLVGIRRDFEAAEITLDDMGVRLTETTGPLFSIELRQRPAIGGLPGHREEADDG